MIKKSWLPHPDLLNVDGSLFGGYIAALADQSLALAAMTRVPADMQTRQIISTRAEFFRPDGELIAEASAQQFLHPIRPLATP